MIEKQNFTIYLKIIIKLSIIGAIPVDTRSTYNYFFIVLLQMGLQRICKLLKKNRIGGRLFPISNKKRVKHLVDKKKSIKVGNSRLLLENLFLKIRKLKKIEQLKLDKIQRLDRSTNRKILMKIDYKGTHYTKLKLLNNQKYSYFFSNFFYKIFKNPVYFINFNYFLKIKVVSFKKLVNNLFFKNKFIKKTIYMYKILRVALASLVFKDSKILVYVIKEVFEAVHYSRHRIYFYF